MLFRCRIRQQVQRSQQRRKSKKRLVYQCLGLQLQEIQCFYRGTDWRTETLYSIAMGLPEMILSGKIRDQQENRNRIRRNQISRRGERGSRWQGCFQLRRGLLFPVLPECGMLIHWPENEDPKNESWKRTEAERGSLKWTPLPVMWAGWTNFYSYLLSCTKKWNVYQTPHPFYPFIHNPALVIVFCISVPCFLHQ